MWGNCRLEINLGIFNETGEKEKGEGDRRFMIK
jgi:hypothetical protein